MSEHFDLVVIGGGSGGMATARRAASYGKKVALIERGRLGGTCVNIGCVPKKVMWHAAEFAAHAAHAADYGFATGVPEHDWTKLVDNRETYIQRLNGIYARNLDKDAVEFVAGDARFVGERRVAVGERELEADHVVIATGGKPHWPDVPGAALGTDSDGFFGWRERPDRVAIVGSGYIACELAGVLNGLGAHVTLLLRKEHVLKHFDAMLGDTLIERMRQAGIDVQMNRQTAELSEAGAQAASSGIVTGHSLTLLDIRVAACPDTCRTKYSSSTNPSIEESPPPPHPAWMKGFAACRGLPITRCCGSGPPVPWLSSVVGAAAARRSTAWSPSAWHRHR